MMAILDTAIGGLLAIGGGMVATWLSARTTRRIRMDEVVAERKVEANKWAYAYMKEIETTLIVAGPKNARQLMANREPWLFENRLFLPGRYPDKWLTLRLKLDEILDLTGSEAVAPLKKRARELANECILEIYKEMRMKALDVSE